MPKFAIFHCPKCLSRTGLPANGPSALRQKSVIESPVEQQLGVALLRDREVRLVLRLERRRERRQHRGIGRRRPDLEQPGIFLQDAACRGVGRREIFRKAVARGLELGGRRARNRYGGRHRRRCGRCGGRCGGRLGCGAGACACAPALAASSVTSRSCAIRVAREWSKRSMKRPPFSGSAHCECRARRWEGRATPAEKTRPAAPR